MSTLVWYLGYGSMMNPVSLKSRNLDPKKSVPCRVPGWRVIFSGGGGMAAIVPVGSTEQIEKANALCNSHGKNPLPECHAVAHLITEDEMSILGEVEKTYNRELVSVIPYMNVGEPAQGRGKLFTHDPRGEGSSGVDQPVDKKVESLCCAVWIMMESPPSDDPKPLPPERYIEICSSGAEHFGVDPEYVAAFRAQPCVPRRKPSEWKTFTRPKGRTFSRAEFRSLATNMDVKERVVFIINGAVVTISTRTNEYASRMVSRHGMDLTLGTARNIYEPKYGGPYDSIGAMSGEHRAWAEDWYWNFLERIKVHPECLGQLEAPGWMEANEEEEERKREQETKQQQRKSHF